VGDMKDTEGLLPHFDEHRLTWLDDGGDVKPELLDEARYHGCRGGDPHAGQRNRLMPLRPLAPVPRGLDAGAAQEREAADLRPVLAFSEDALRKALERRGEIPE